MGEHIYTLRQDDLDRESRIRALQQALVHAATREDLVAVADRLRREISGRSPDMVAYMEHARGIA